MYKRIVVKIGTKVLSDDNGQVNEVTLSKVVDQISALKNSGFEVILVSSGAVGSGRGLLRTKHELETKR